jgi:hypothetical protein
MDANGPTITGLQIGRGPAAGRYSAVGANYNPDSATWRKLLDVGIDSFFAGANDLVVPTDGAWRVDPDPEKGSIQVIPPERVGCFGLDGNIRPQSVDVHHLTVCAQPETRVFIDRAFAEQPQDLPVLDISQPRRSRRIFRGAAPVMLAAAPRAPVERPADPLPAAVEAAVNLRLPPAHNDRTLHFVISEIKGNRDTAQLLAMYRGAVIVESFPLRGTRGASRRGRSRSKAVVTAETAARLDAGERFYQIISRHEAIQNYIEDKAPAALPTDEELRTFGALLFETLFVGKIRRLYDAARSEQQNGTLNIILTCTIPWVANKPWEFVYDPVRYKFLATEEIHFIRNVTTPVPAQQIPDHDPPLRILVVAAQPVGTVILSLEDEEARIRMRFEPLLAAGIVKIDVLAAATVDLLQDRIVDAQRFGRPYDIVHFMGHGEFDSEADQGHLIFNAIDGLPQYVNIQTLREILCGRGIKMLFLNACESARDSSRSANRGMAQSLVEGGLPSVVANQYKVLDPSAVAFAQRFYAELANGGTLGEAAREARIAVNHTNDREIIDWAVPVLYARDPDLRMCPRPSRERTRSAADRPVTTSGAPLAQATRGASPAKYAVGVADLAGHFPELNATLTALNLSQDVF